MSPPTFDQLFVLIDEVPDYGTKSVTLFIAFDICKKQYKYIENKT